MIYRTRVMALGFVLGALVILYGVGLLTLPRARSQRSASDALIDWPSTAEIGELEFRSGAEGQSRRLQRVGDGWQVFIEDEWFPANGERIEQAIEEMSRLRREQQVTRNEELLPNFELDDEAANRLILRDTDGASLVEVLFGKQEAARNWIYARLQESPEVYLTGDGADFYFRQGDGYWSLLGLYPDDLDPQVIISLRVDATIAIEEGDEPSAISYRLLRDRNVGGEWVVEGEEPPELDQSRINTLISTLVGADASAYAPTRHAEAAGLDEPAASISFTLDNGAEYGLSIGGRDPGDPNRFYARASGEGSSSFLYYISKWTVDQVAPQMDALLLMNDDDATATQ